MSSVSHSSFDKLKALVGLERIYTSRILRSGDCYTVRGQERRLPELRFHGDPKTYLVNQRMLDETADLMEYADRLLREHGIDYVAACGTLLGAIRHAGQTPWDDDVDLFICKHEDMPRLGALRERVEADGFQLIRVNAYYKLARGSDPLAFPFVDFYELWDQIKPDYLYPLRRVPYEDFEINVPQRAEEALTDYFGDTPCALDTVVHDRLTSHRLGMTIFQLFGQRVANVIGDAAAWIRDTFDLEKSNR